VAFGICELVSGIRKTGDKERDVKAMISGFETKVRWISGPDSEEMTQVSFEPPLSEAIPDGNARRVVRYFGSERTKKIHTRTSHCYTWV